MFDPLLQNWCNIHQYLDHTSNNGLLTTMQWSHTFVPKVAGRDSTVPFKKLLNFYGKSFCNIQTWAKLKIMLRLFTCLHLL